MSAQATIAETSAYTVDEFCQAHRFSRSTFYSLLKTGQGPVVMKVSGRLFVSAEAAAAWRRRMEQSPNQIPA
jgi:predicted DNA-binding transcriptional regulator AlpA